MPPVYAPPLPPSLRERLRPAHGHGSSALPEPRAGAHVLYLLRVAHRCKGNPSLEVGLHMARALDLPLVCVAVVEDSFPASMRASWRPTERAAAFRLEALRELQPSFAARGTALWVHVERDGHRAAVAMSLAAKSALVICDEHFGVEPHASASERVSQAGAPLWLCDTACTLPACTLAAGALSGGNAGFLRATSAARAVRLADGWFAPPAPPPQRAPPTPPPAWNVDLSGSDGALEAVLAQPSRRDHTVARVRHTRGGPRAAEARWAAYVRGGGLRSYASHRNNPLASDGKGASRMSAFVNAGMVDPYALARDASTARADKYLSEFVGFRESACLWCLLHPGGYADAAVAVPPWAQQQMRPYVAAAAMAAAAAGGGGGGFASGAGGGAGGDAAVPSLEALELGRSGDALWDDCQRSLLIAGELHNNVRMAWGKAIPPWHAAALRAQQTPPGDVIVGGAGGVAGSGGSVARGGVSGGGSSGGGGIGGGASASVRLQAALDLLIRLNDRFALDGGAPPSYGGLLWCLGWRDRPGANGCPTRRPTSVMASKIRPGDLERRARRLAGPMATAFAATPTAAAATTACPASSSSSSSTATAASAAAVVSCGGASRASEALPPPAVQPTPSSCEAMESVEVVNQKGGEEDDDEVIELDESDSVGDCDGDGGRCTGSVAAAPLAAAAAAATAAPPPAASTPARAPAAAPAPKRPRSASVNGAAAASASCALPPQSTLWHYLNRQSAASLPPGSGNSPLR